MIERAAKEHSSIPSIAALNAHLSSTQTKGQTMQNQPPAADLSHSVLGEIALKHLNIETLDERKSDGLDFHEVSVWNIRAALEAAFAAGKATADLSRFA